MYMRASLVAAVLLGQIACSSSTRAYFSVADGAVDGVVDGRPDTNVIGFDSDIDPPDGDEEWPDTSAVDSGRPDTRPPPWDSGGGFDTRVPDTSPDTGPVSDLTTGKPCSSSATCDTTGDGYAFCTSETFAIGALNPTPVCLQYDSSGFVCTPSTSTSINFCDGALGLCKGDSSGGATCEPMCVMENSGVFSTACAGRNSCNVEAYSVGTDGKTKMYGTCQGGCAVDSDCPSGNKCDPVHKYCMISCTSDTTCTSKWSGAPANWKCDLTRGACALVYTKTIGQVCTSSSDCLCMMKTGATSGYCTNYCKTGSTACASGFTCDATLPRTDSAGSVIFNFSTQPAGVAGFCMKNCATNLDCPTGQLCEASAGLTQKTCRPS